MLWILSQSACFAVVREIIWEFIHRGRLPICKNLANLAYDLKKQTQALVTLVVFLKKALQGWKPVTLCLFIKLVISLDIVVTDFCNLIWRDNLDTYILKYWFNLLPSKYFSSARRCKIKSRFAQNYAPRLCWEQCIGERFCLSAHSILFSLDAIFTRLRALFWAVGCTHAFSWAVLEWAAWDTV